MLEYCTFSFRILLLSDTHVGDGSEAPLKDLCDGDRKAAYERFEAATKGEGVDGTTALFARGDRGLPVIASTGLRGALRRLLAEQDKKLAEELFGPALLADGATVESGHAALLWLCGGLADPAVIPSGCEELPFWDPAKLTYILPGNARDRDTGAVERYKLYNTEYVPAGAEFCFDAVFRGSEDTVGSKVEPLLTLMACPDGFKLGAARGYEYGLARLAGALRKPRHHKYSVVGRSFAAPTPFELGPGRSNGRNYREFRISCPKPFFIQDPIRHRTDENLDWQALQREPNYSVITGKAFLQCLRMVAARLELEEALSEDGSHPFAYEANDLPVDDPGGHLRSLDRLANLTRTQRLFGVPGWAKIVNVHRVLVDPEPPGVYRAQTIKLDTFTQGPIDNALVEMKVPVGVGATIWLDVQQRRYPQNFAEEEQDLAFLERVLERARMEDAIILGHASGAGFGWFRLEEAAA
ncbi:RAMP superfamily CRISPR-associated protein [Afifella sp. JA880]|uniref:RAMP superfamily CRISPR-associated protein n=1 Tax=Afifella sp. JA880 TaxID=2975280 RepID=UPI0021BBB266|nr:RAMP superfamily CRISPR-associated protein [Afifella sp. JA880]MCT8268015.1 RAMP superfamily CRISPR-associated protein [Afifella sp. JA880]